MRRIDAPGEVRNAEFQIRRRDGQPVAVLENARAHARCRAARSIGYEGTFIDITERKRAEQAMFAEKERAQVTLQSIGDAVISTDAQGLIDYMNPVAESLTGWSVEEARGRPIGEVLNLIHEMTREPIANPLLGVLGRGEARRRDAIRRCSSRAPGRRSPSRNRRRRSATGRARSSAR